MNLDDYFSLDARQRDLYARLPALYEEWNGRVNVVSRKDVQCLTEHHVLHSLALAKFTTFAPGTRIIDVGTGGGFPGIPLAIFFPEVHFTLIDGIGKKVRVAEAVREALGLDNVECRQARSEELKGSFDFVVSRAVCPLPDFVRATRHLVARQQRNSIMNGVLYLKGGDFQAELKTFGRSALVEDIAPYFPGRDYFEGKKVVHIIV